MHAIDFCNNSVLEEAKNQYASILARRLLDRFYIPYYKIVMPLLQTTHDINALKDAMANALLDAYIAQRVRFKERGSSIIETVCEPLPLEAPLDVFLTTTTGQEIPRKDVTLVLELDAASNSATVSGSYNNKVGHLITINLTPANMAKYQLTDPNDAILHEATHAVTRMAMLRSAGQSKGFNVTQDMNLAAFLGPGKAAYNGVKNIINTAIKINPRLKDMDKLRPEQYQADHKAMQVLLYLMNPDEVRSFTSAPARALANRKPPTLPEDEFMRIVMSPRAKQLSPDVAEAFDKLYKYPLAYAQKALGISKDDAWQFLVGLSYDKLVLRELVSQVQAYIKEANVE